MLLHAVAHVLELTLAILMDFCREDWGDLVDLSLPKRGMGRKRRKAVEILSFFRPGRAHYAGSTAPHCKIVDRSFRRSLSVAPRLKRKRRSRNGRRRQNSLPPNT